MNKHLLQKTEKVLFLDIDGVLNHKLHYKELYKKNKCNIPIGIELDKLNINGDSVELLNELVQTLGFKVVLSSTWRYVKTLEYMNELFKECGASFEFYDFTPFLSIQKNDFEYDFCPRGLEIDCWIRNNVDDKKHNYKNYIILDDDSDMLYWQKDNYVCIDNYCGLTESQVFQIIRKFI